MEWPEDISTIINAPIYTPTARARLRHLHLHIYILIVPALRRQRQPSRRCPRSGTNMHTRKPITMDARATPTRIVTAKLPRRLHYNLIPTPIPTCIIGLALTSSPTWRVRVQNHLGPEVQSPALVICPLPNMTVHRDGPGALLCLR